MPHPAPSVSDALRELPGAPVCVGFSGGLDSTVLLHALAACRGVRAQGLRAWHVHHGLQAQADAWEAHCREVCEALGIPLAVSRVTVDDARGEGREAAARRARHAVFEEGLGDGEVLAFAHHRDDQAETFLLRALRASGPDGLAAMRPWRRFGRGHLWRPLLALPRAALLDYAHAHGLRWIEDPSNADPDFDRNFLRQRVLPLLRERWPQAGAALAASAGLCGEASDLLDETDAGALAAAATDDPAVLSRAALRRLPAPRRARVLRRWVAGLGLPPLPAEGVARIEREVLDARADAAACFAWHGAVVEAWGDRLRAGTPAIPLRPEWQADWDGAAPLRLPDGGEWRLTGNARSSDDASAAEFAPARAGFGRRLLAHARRGGERIVLPDRTHSHALKHVLQERRVPPWRRVRLPLLSDANGELLAAGDVACSATFAAWLRERGLRLAWDDGLRCD